MAYAWNWFGLANILASTLLLVLGLLFLRARRSEFTVVFAAYCVLAAGQKFTGGVALYFAADAATQVAWLTAANAFLLASTPSLAHALLAFVAHGRLARTPALRWLLYAPFAPVLALLLLGVVPLGLLSLALAGVFLSILAVFLFPVARRAVAPTKSVGRAQSRYLLAYLLVALSFSIEARVLLYMYGTMPWWELSIAYMAATGILLYGILRTHLFDIDLKLKIAIRQSTLAATFIAVFFVVSELATNILSERIGAVLGIVAAGLLLFALAPIQRLAERLADTAMPGVTPSPEYVTYRKLQVYRGALESALRDGVVTSDERVILDRLQQEMGIAPSDAVALEREVAAARTG